MSDPRVKDLDLIAGFSLSRDSLVMNVDSFENLFSWRPVMSVIGSQVCSLQVFSAAALSPLPLFFILRPLVFTSVCFMSSDRHFVSLVQSSQGGIYCL